MLAISALDDASSVVDAGADEQYAYAAELATARAALDRLDELSV